MLSGDSPERKPSFSQASSDDDTEIYVRKEGANVAPTPAQPTPAPAAAPAPEKEVTLGGEDTEITEPVRNANPDPGPFATFLAPNKSAGPAKAMRDTPADRPLPSSDADTEVYVGRQPKPEERIASTAETGQFLIAPNAEGDGTYSYPEKPKAAMPAKPVPNAKDPAFQTTVNAIHQKRSTAESGAFLIPPSGAAGGAGGDSFYEYPSTPKEAKPTRSPGAPLAPAQNDRLRAAMMYKGPISDDGSILYEGKPKEQPAAPAEQLRTTMMYKGPAMGGDNAVLYDGKPREIPRHDLERAKPTETGSDGTELYVGHKPTRSVQGIESNNNFVLYGGKVEATKPSIKPGPPTEGPNATKYYANPRTVPGNKVVERNSMFDVYESTREEPQALPRLEEPAGSSTTPKPKDDAAANAPVVRPSWQDGNAVLYTSKDPTRRGEGKYPSLVNLRPERGYERSVSDSNGFVFYEKPKAPREPRAAGPVATDTTGSYLYYEKAKQVEPAPATSVPAASSASNGYELYEAPRATVAPPDAPQPPTPEPAPFLAAPVKEPPTAPVAVPAEPVAVEDDFEVYERAPAEVVEPTPSLATPEPEASPIPPVPEPARAASAAETFAPLDLPLAAAEPIPEPEPVVEQTEVVQAEPLVEAGPEMALLLPPVVDESPQPEPLELAEETTRLPAMELEPVPELDVVIDIIESAEPTRIEPEAASLEPAPVITDLPGETKLDGVDVVEAPLAPLPLAFATGNMPTLPRFEPPEPTLPEIETIQLMASSQSTQATGLDREEPTPEYIPKEFTLEASGRGTVDMRIGFVVSEFNYDITTMMLERAKSHAEFLGAKVGPILHVPGTFDMGLAVKKLLGRRDVDGVVTLGAVIQGETDHDQVVLQHASRKIADLSIDSGKPVALGITGPGMTRLQAMERIDRAKDAVEAVVKLHGRLKAIET